MNKLSCFVVTTLIGSSISFAHAEPKMSGTIYIMTEVDGNLAPLFTSIPTAGAAGALPTHTSRSTATKTLVPSKWVTSVHP